MKVRQTRRNWRHDALVRRAAYLEWSRTGETLKRQISAIYNESVRLPS